MGQTISLEVHNHLPFSINVYRQECEVHDDGTIVDGTAPTPEAYRPILPGASTIFEYYIMNKRRDVKVHVKFKDSNGDEFDAVGWFTWDNPIAFSFSRQAPKKIQDRTEHFDNPFFVSEVTIVGGFLHWNLLPTTMPRLKDLQVAPQSIIVLNPLAPVYDLDATGDSNFLPSNLKIWDTTTANPDPHPDPVCVCLNRGVDDANGILRIRLDISDVKKVADINFVVSGVQEQTDLTVLEESQPFKFQSSGSAGYANVDLKFSAFSDIAKVSDNGFVPYGIKSTVVEGKPRRRLQLILKVAGTKRFHLIKEVDVEIYVIQRNTAPFFINYGIPLDLLRVMVLPVLDGVFTKKLDSVQKYIEWTVTRLHNSLTDGNKDHINDGFEGPIHTYRYDVWDYATRYSSKGVESRNSGFRLEDWLRYRKETAPFPTLNCYDCASIVLTSLSLGVPYKLLQWRYIAPFGYLPLQGTSLIGWGRVNNTTGFQNDQSLRIIKPEDKAIRSGFANHAMVTVELYPGKAPIALDACAGPATGSLDIDGYIARCISNDGGKGTEARAERSDAQALGFVSDNEAGYSRPPGSWTYDAVNTKRGDLSKEETKRYDSFVEELGSMDLPKFTIDLRRMYPALAQALKDIVEPNSQGESSPVVVDTDQDANVIGWSYSDIYVEITICRNAAVATSRFGGLLSTLSADPTSILKTDLDLKKASGKLTVQSKIGSGWKVLLSDNYVAEIESFSETDAKRQEKVERVALEVENFFQNPTFVEETKAADAGGDSKYIYNIVPKPSSADLKVGETLKITVEDKYAREVRAHSRTGVTYQLSRTQDTSGDTTSWIFTFIAQRSGSDVIAFTACHIDTFGGPAHTQGVHVQVA